MPVKSSSGSGGPPGGQAHSASARSGLTWYGGSRLASARQRCGRSSPGSARSTAEAASVSACRVAAMSMVAFSAAPVSSLPWFSR